VKAIMRALLSVVTYLVMLAWFAVIIAPVLMFLFNEKGSASMRWLWIAAVIIGFLAYAYKGANPTIIRKLLAWLNSR
jgi:hypothetical protein